MCKSKIADYRATKTTVRQQDNLPVVLTKGWETNRADGIRADLSRALVMADMLGTHWKSGKLVSSNVQVLPVTNSMSPFVGLRRYMPVFTLGESSA